MPVCKRSPGLPQRVALVLVQALAVGAALLLDGTASDAAVRNLRPARAVPVVVAAKPKPAPALPPAEPFPADAPIKTELAVGGLRASFAPVELNSILPVGGSAFLTVTIADPGGNKFVSLLAEAETGMIASISGKGLQVSPAAGGQTAEIPLPASGPTAVTVELAVKNGAEGPGGKLRSRLRITLLPQKGGRDEAVVSWQLADCAGDYKHELAKIIDDRRARMLGTLDVAEATQPDLPTAWLFAPPKPAPVPVTCKPQKGKAAMICAPAKQPAPENSKPSEEPQILNLADAVMRLRGALPQFQRHTQPLRQASFTLLSGLRIYMEQDAHPALCSGVEYMIEYYQSRTGLLRNTIDEAKAALAKAQLLAVSHLTELTQSAPAPAVGQQLASNDGAAVSTAPAAAGLPLAELADRVGMEMLGTADLADLKADTGIWPKLRRLKALLAGPSTAALSSDRREAATAALRMVEASQYLSAAVPKYTRLDETIYGTMSAIVDAHKKACVCGP